MEAEAPGQRAPQAPPGQAGADAAVVVLSALCWCWIPFLCGLDVISREALDLTASVVGVV